MKPKYITIHASATNPERIYTIEQLKRDHLARGFSDVGYHFYINQSGEFHLGRNERKQGAHVKGHNKDNIGICLEGGVDFGGNPVFNYTENQMSSLRYILTNLKSVYGIKDENIKGHRDWFGDSNGDGVVDSRDWLKECPCMDIQEEMKKWG